MPDELTLSQNRPTTRGSKPAIQQFALPLPKSLHAKAMYKSRCEGRPLRDVVLEALTEYVSDVQIEIVCDSSAA